MLKYLHWSKNIIFELLKVFRGWRNYVCLIITKHAYIFYCFITQLMCTCMYRLMHGYRDKRVVCITTKGVPVDWENVQVCV